jgi:hypothetical protein
MTLQVCTLVHTNVSLACCYSTVACECITQILRCKTKCHHTLTSALSSHSPHWRDFSPPLNTYALCLFYSCCISTVAFHGRGLHLCLTFYFQPERSDSNRPMNRKPMSSTCTSPSCPCDLVTVFHNIKLKVAWGEFSFQSPLYLWVLQRVLFLPETTSSDSCFIRSLFLILTSASPAVSSPLHRSLWGTLV